MNLDDCNGGPVVLNITAQPGDGNLLGNLLCDVSNLLNDGGILGQGGLTGDLLNNLTGALTNILNGALNGTDTSTGILSSLTGGSSGGTAVAQQAMGGNNGNGQGGSHTCDILNLDVGPLNLDLLGLQVTTSEICLDVYAQRGSGQLLGNLLCGVSHLLDNPGNPVGGILAKLNKVDRILSNLG